ncbi:DEAH-box RNA helicase [Apiospora phragmitis]|uniref:RNA helicase n=1 Tax=Apiospora phragmitis TaxID=2905665 RepID=A0ABR1UID2_9PEZI
MPAKKFVPRQRKHKVLARQKASTEAQAEDSNQLELTNDSRQELDARKDQLRKELQGEGPKISGKKAKHLEKYIETKIRKDENRALLAKLAASKIDTSLFSSSRNLGQKGETKKQHLQRALREHAAGIADHGDELFEERPTAPESDAGIVPQKHTPAASSQDEAQPSKPQASETAPAQPAAGSGLKRPLDVDDDGRPVIKKRQKRGGVKSKVSLAASKTAHPEPVYHEESDSDSDSDEDEWKGFSSENEPDDQEPGMEEDSSSEDDEETESSDDDDDDDSDDGEPDTKQRSSAFKAWAHQQRNEAMGYTPVESTAMLLDIPRPANFEPRPLEQDPLPLELQPTTNVARKAFAMPVTRPAEIQESRLKLPVVGEEQKIMEAIHNNNVVVICGATGSGKTTQVPQFLFEAGYGSPDSPTPGLIGVTQPRKVAAVSMSKRVGQELGNHSHKVAYQIRFEGTADDKTAVKFMTDGVLLREVSNAISLKKYSAVIIDEAHERSVNTDILIGMLSRVVKLREEMAAEDKSIKPLKLIIMSATLRIDDLTKNPVLFPSPPPVLDVEGRQFPVTVHFARQTRHDYVEEAYKKILRGHRKLPQGGFLIFLTGHDEISRLSKLLKSSSTGLNSAAYPKVRISANDAPLEVEDIEFGNTNDTTQDDYNEVEIVDDVDDEGNEEDDAEFDIPDQEGGTGPLKMHILPLYSLLPTKEQMKVFEPPPKGSRQIILATNVAETSLTIPGIQYVFDCGRSKERRFDKDNGVQSYEISWVSKASANQRAGRAGRTGPGHCYRLYSSAVYERDFREFADPELLRMPIEGVVLQLKAMRLQHVVNFPFPTPPERQSLAKAEKLLKYLSAVTPEGQATDIGTTMARFPLPPRFARILLVGHLHDCMPYTIAMVAGLSVADIFIPETQAIPAIAEREEGTYRTNDDVKAETEQQQIRKRYNEVHRNFRSLDDTSDAIKLLQAVGEFAHDPTEEWCADHFARFKGLNESLKLRRQITNLLQKDIPAFANLTFQEKLDRPSTKQIAALKQMVAAGFIDQVAIRGDLAPVPPELQRRPGRAIDVPYIPLHPPATQDDADKLVYIHPSSSLAHRSTQELPDYIVYSHLQRQAPSVDGMKRPKTRMLALTNVTGAQLAALAKGTPLITYGKPIKEIKTNDPLVREIWAVPYLRAEGTGGQGWPLPVKKITQRKVPGKGWVAQ